MDRKAPEVMAVVESESLLLKALRQEPVDHLPVWFMRQAGRALPQYRAIREKHSFLDICRTPQLSAEVTLFPIESLGVDAAIIFADIMTPLIGIGIDIDLVDGVGPVVANPIISARDAQALTALEPEADIPDVLETIRIVRRALEDRGVPLIGFSGAPFTLASYLIEGRASRDFHRTKQMMYLAPDLFGHVMDRLADIVSLYLHAQIDAGVQVVQLFDSWAGILAPADYARFVQPYSTRILSSIEARHVPSIHFSTGTSGFLENIRDAGGTTIGVDWRVSLDEAWRRIGYDRGIQGNLDPAVLLGPAENMEAEAARVIDLAGERAGYIFNLGHGVHPNTAADSLRRLVDFVHWYSAK